ncbi:MAG: methyltransferase family protein [Anaerolineae bacterium]
MLSLLIRTIGGFLFLVLILALALFASAGTLDFWQAWTYLAVFSVCIILITLYLVFKDRRLLESRLNVGPAAERQRSQQILQSFASLFFIGLYIVSGLDRRFGWSHVSTGLSLVSDGLVTLGLFVVFLVFRVNTYTSAIIEIADQQHVVSTGPYSLVRHPMYSGAMLLLIFTPLALGSWVGVPFALPVIAVVIARLLDEEKFLARSLPGYEDYRRKVRHRLVPGVW